MLILIKEGSTGPSYMHKFINMHCNSKTLFKDFKNPYLRTLKTKLETLIKKIQNLLIKAFNLD